MGIEQPSISTATGIVRREPHASARRVSELGAQRALHYRRGGPSNTTVVMYDETALSRWIEQAIEKSGIVWGAIPGRARALCAFRQPPPGKGREPSCSGPVH